MSVEHVYEVRCDFTEPSGEGCEEVSEATGETKGAARWFAEKTGWLTAHENGSDYCPEHRELVADSGTAEVDATTGMGWFKP